VDIEQDDLMADRQPVRLDHFLKLCGAAGSGGQAKLPGVVPCRSVE
jgi:ribosome-associated protein YbcJ (S4-like RNA binding protein)